MTYQQTQAATLAAPPSSSDAVMLEIIRGKLLAIVDEMGLVLARSSMSPVIYEVLDFACGICDPAGQLVAQTNGITVFTGTFSTQIGAVLRKFSGSIHPGDIFLMNNPYDGGTHLCDVAVIKPIFIRDRFVAFAIAVAHWSEVGGKTPGSLPSDSTEVFQEGIRFPPLKLFDKGTRQDVIFEIIEANVRLPKMSLGDLNAELASVRIAEARLEEISKKYSIERLVDAFDHILTTSERLSRAAIVAMPEGTYVAEDWIDGDGISNERFPVKVAVTIIGDRIIADFTGSSPQLTGPVNCARGALVSAVKTVLKAVVNPAAPSNEGWFRPLEVIAPAGTVFTAELPAAVGWYYEGTGQASELVWKALAPVLKDRVSAGSSNSLCVTVLAGVAEDAADPYVLVEPGMVGWGGTDERDGASVVSAITNGDTFNYSIELLEAKFPLHVHQYALNVAGGVGAGRHRGGYGSIREYEILSPSATLSASFGRSIERPWGVDGGYEGSCNRLEVVRDGETIHGARMPTMALKRGDRVKLVTGGGGGFGDPWSRPVQEVAADIAGDYLSAGAARDLYGVEVSENGEIDHLATSQVRGQRKAL
jgi:N-methylhydantoinase B